jgi:hypothetical protein
MFVMLQLSQLMRWTWQAAGPADAIKARRHGQPPDLSADNPTACWFPQDQPENILATTNG